MWQWKIVVLKRSHFSPAKLDLWFLSVTGSFPENRWHKQPQTEWELESQTATWAPEVHIKQWDTATVIGKWDFWAGPWTHLCNKWSNHPSNPTERGAETHPKRSRYGRVNLGWKAFGTVVERMCANLTRVCYPFRIRVEKSALSTRTVWTNREFDFGVHMPTVYKY